MTPKNIKTKNCILLLSPYSILFVIFYIYLQIIMGRTIPSFRIAAILEEEKKKLFRKYLRNKNKKILFKEMFSIANLYNSACYNAMNPISPSSLYFFSN